jgi:hypothetical protein
MLRSDANTFSSINHGSLMVLFHIKKPFWYIFEGLRMETFGISYIWSFGMFYYYLVFIAT